MIGEYLHYGLDILFTVAALGLFIGLWWVKKLDWTEAPNDTLFLEDQDG